MVKIQFCPYCGNKLQNSEAKFCGKCGETLEILHGGVQSGSVKKESNIQKEQVQQQINQTREGAKETFSKLKKATGDNQLTSKAKIYTSNLNKNPQQKKRLIKGASGILVIVVLIFGWNWFSNRDYRQAMATGDSYFSRGEYGEAVTYYKQAHDLKPGDSKALLWYDSTAELGQYWIWINEGDFEGSSVSAYEDLEEKIPTIKDKKIKEAYEEAYEAIPNTLTFQIESRTVERYKNAYGLD